MVFQAMLLLTLLVTANGCALKERHSSDGLSKPRLMSEIYAGSVGDAQKDTARFIEENLKEQKTFGYVKPYIPVVEGPVVRKVWVPDHKSKDDSTILVGGHWVYLMIEGPKWFTETEKKDHQIPAIVPTKPVAQAAS